MVSHQEIMDRFRASVNHPPGRASIGSDRPRIGYFCPLTPLEMMHAAGYTPVRIFRFDTAIKEAEAHLPAYCCHLVRGGLEAGMSGLMIGLDGIVFSHTCDSMQNVADIWHRAVKQPHFYVVRLPTRTDSTAAPGYLEATLTRFREELERWAGRPVTNDDLAASIAVYSTLRRRLRRLYELNADRPGHLSAEDFLYIVLSAFRLPPETWIELTEPILQDLDGAQPPFRPVIPLFLAGNLGDDPTFYRLLDESGAAVADDDLCTGRRTLDYDTLENGDPISALARAFIGRPLCPCKHTGLNPAEALTAKVKASPAKGVVFLIQKYCEPHFFEYPELARALTAAEIPHLLLETSRPGLNLEQVRVRLEAFLEILESA